MIVKSCWCCTVSVGNVLAIRVQQVPFGLALLAQRQLVGDGLGCNFCGVSVVVPFLKKNINVSSVL